MLARPKIICSIAVIMLLTIGFVTGVVGKNYNASKDFICCKGNQLLLHRYYTNSFFWIKFNSGFVIEQINTNAAGCNVVCSD